MKPSIRKRILSLLVPVCLLIQPLGSALPVHASVRSDYNDRARAILQEYYEPEDHTDTGMWNIENAYTKEEYADKDQKEALYALTDSLVSEGMTDEEKVRAVHDWICANIAYAEDTDDYNSYPYSALANPFTVFKDRQAVCYGYANLTQLMLQHLDIPCVVVRGNSSTHVWNAVYLNDRWIFTDNTWDTTTSTTEELSYRYYLMDDAVYDENYSTQYIESWQGDVCYFPVYVTPKYASHEIVLDANGGVCIEKIPFTENTKRLIIPVPTREGRVFKGWTNDHDLHCFYYEPMGGWYMSDTLEGITDNITFRASYAPIVPNYTIPSGLQAETGDRLSDIELPEGFSWTDGTLPVGEAGEHIFTVTYTPDDLEEYVTVTNIEVTVTVNDKTPTVIPTATPTTTPTAVPTATPTAKPTAVPTATPTAKPTAVPTATPTAKPTAVPTATPTAKPTAVPTATPTAKPTAVPTATPTAKPVRKTTEGIYQIIPAVNAKNAAAVNKKSILTGAKLSTAASNKTEEQAFVFSKNSDGTFRITSYLSGMALTCGTPKGNSAPVTLEKTSSDAYQKWEVIQNNDGTVSLYCRKANRMLDVAGARKAAGAAIQGYRKNGTAAQKFTLKTTSFSAHKYEGTYIIRSSKNKNYVVDVSGNKTKNGTNIHLYRKNGTTAQSFRIVYSGNGYYRIEGVYSGKVLDVTGASKRSGANVQLYTWNGTSAQLWKISQNKDGTVTITNKNGNALDVSGGLMCNSRNIQVYRPNGTGAQKWTLKKI